MASHPVRTLVMRGSEVVDRVERPPRRTADGRLAIEYLGLVYPLDAEGCIDLDGAWLYPRQAPICIDPPEPSDPLASKAWLLDSEGHRPYIFLDASEEALLEAVRRLTAAGFSPERWGRSFRNGADGALFAWFIRLSRQDEKRAPTQWEVEQVFRGLEFGQVADEELASGGPVHTVEALRRQVVDVEAQLAEEVAARDAAEAANAEIRGHYQRETTRARDAAAFLRAALGRLEANVAPAGVAEENPETEALSQALAAARAELNEAMSQWLVSEEERKRAAEEAAQLRARIAELEMTRRGTHNQGSGRAKAWLRELHATLAIFAPAVELVRDSAEFIATEVQDRSDLYAKLRDLNQNRTALKAKRVQAAEGWMELHFSTGLARDGRLYFRKTDADGARWTVLVSDKAAQPRDFDWIAQQ